MRDAVPAGMDVAAGEYGYSPFYFRRMLSSQAVDVLQLDATRCRGFTGFLAGAAVAASFAPLLFGTSAYLGLMASYLRREEELGGISERVRDGAEAMLHLQSGWREDLRYGRFQKHLCGVTILWTFFSGFEALYSHYKSNFRIWAQWTPVLLTPPLIAAAAGAIRSRRIANTALPLISALALADGAAGFYYHARGIFRRPGGAKKPMYNILYGPPIFAPLLFAACGFLGLMASLLRREREK